MSTGGVKGTKPSAAARAEAAAWVARLHGPNRTPDVESGLRRWLADNPERTAAFELLTDTWEKSASVRRRPIEQVASWERPGFRISFSRAALATAATCVLAVGATIFYLHTDAVTTGIGELRVIALDDGSRVHLNTSTRVRVHYDKQVRGITLDRGEALFEVAKRSGWPFIVTAGGRQIRALGTEFVVRRDEQDLAVTLVEGKVTVSPTASSELGPGQGSGPPAGVPAGGRLAAAQPSSLKSVALVPGERLTFAGAGAAKIDRPALERVTAWERGQVALDNTSLADAIAEMNRYSREQIVIDDPALAAIRISGIFQVGDSANFAQALARTYHIRLISQPNKIVLAAGKADGTADPQ